MGAILGLIVLIVCFELLGRAIANSRDRAWAGPRSGRMRSRAAAPRPPRGQVRADVRRMWEQARSTNWLEAQRHARANGGGTVTAAPPKQPLTTRLRLKPQTVTTTTAAAGNGKNGPPARPSQPPPRPSAQPGTNGGTTMSTGTSTASAEKLIEGVNEIHAHAASGGINAKREALNAAHEAAGRFASTMEMLGRAMSEPDSRYGPEITEPIVKAGAQLRAAAIQISEGKASLDTLVGMSVGELAASARQAPHHSELSENGTR
jgi:hypothetical protein